MSSVCMTLTQLSPSYGKKPAFPKFDYRFEGGKLYSVMGRSGSGKTTLLRCLSGLHKQYEGKIEINSRDIQSMSRLQFNRKVGLIYQNHGVLPRSSVLTNVLVGRLSHVSWWRRTSHWFQEVDYRSAEEALHRMHIIDQQYKQIEHLSGGQQQRVAIARCLSHDPDIVLADEPVSNLDPFNARNVMTYLKDMARLGKIVIVNLHQPEISEAFADCMINMDEHHGI